MRKSNLAGLRGKSGGTITVLETRVHRHSARNARVAFIVTAVIVGMLTMTVAAGRMHPILAMMLGVVVGTAIGALAWVLVRIWPVVRLLWWWTPEIVSGLILVYGWTALARHTDLVVRLLAVIVLVGVPALVAPVRRRIVAVVWCVIVRHRLRTAFAQFIISNQSGTLPFIFWARPTPVGERVLVRLRPGLSIADLESRLDKLAVTCWASSATVERASAGDSSSVRLDIRRRTVLNDIVDSPLVDLVDPESPQPLRAVKDVPTALDLPDVADPTIVLPRMNGRAETSPRKATPSQVAVPASVVSADGEDVSDWID